MTFSYSPKFVLRLSIFLRVEAGCANLTVFSPVHPTEILSFFLSVFSFSCWLHLFNELHSLCFQQLICFSYLHTELHWIVQILILHQCCHQILICFSLAAYFHLISSVVPPVDLILSIHQLHLMLSHQFVFHPILHWCTYVVPIPQDFLPCTTL